MKDLYLKFKSKEQAERELLKCGFEQSEVGELYCAGICLDTIGAIYKVVDAEAEEPEYTVEPGYHVNLRVINDEQDVSGLDEFIITPKTPARVWA